MKKGTRQAVKNCVRLKSGEKAVIISDKITKKIADYILAEAKAISPGNVKIFVMEDFGIRSRDGKNPLKFPKKIGNALKGADVSFYIAQAYPGELKSFRIPMVKIIEANKKLRHAHMPNFVEIMMQTGMNVDYKKVDDMCKRVYKAAKNAKKIKVNTPAGTNFIATFNSQYKWLKSGPYITPRQWGNLPAGEVFTCVGNIKQGKIVVDGVLGDYFDAKYGVLEEYPVEIKINNGRAASFKTKNKKLKKDLEQYTSQDENANRIGEFAIGTNIGLKKLIGRMLQDEKYPGVHLSLGHGYPEKTGSDWSSDGYLDMVLKNCTVQVDDDFIMKQGKFLI